MANDTPHFPLVGLLAADGAMLLVQWSRLRRLRLRWSVVGIGAGLRKGATRAVLIGLGATTYHQSRLRRLR